jgi:predicted phosphodiesterase
VSGPFTRILSDIHYGDHASRVHRLAQLRPLLDGPSHVVLNGDTLDTRRGPRPAFTTELRAEIVSWIASSQIPIDLLTGNHDPDISALHHLTLADGQIFVTHGDVIFDNIVPWGRDAAHISSLIATELARLDSTARTDLAARLAIWRSVAAQIPQRHQSEANRLKYLLHFAADTVWPPLRIFRVLAAWRNAPRLSAELARQHYPQASFILTGHTHRPGIWHQPNGVTVVNTGAFCPPSGGYTVDLHSTNILIRRIEYRHDEFHAGAPLAEFSLAAPRSSPTMAS